jgi:hypothetical protein
MNNFVVENNNDFNNYLMKLISLDDLDGEEDENVCLISGNPLNEYSIPLACGHKFNYIPLINEIKNQKKYSKLEITRLKPFHIKCPYCRNIQKGVIPYYEKIFKPKLKGINWPPCKLSLQEKGKINYVIKPVMVIIA